MYEAQAENAVPANPAPPIIQSSVPLPHKLDVKGNLSQNWKRWKQVWNSYEIVTNLRVQSDEYRTATFVTCVGPEALEIYNSLPFEEEEDKQDITKIIDLMENHCLGVTNTIYERYIFNNRDQKSGETIDEYCTQLKSLAQTCEFLNLKDELIRDRIVCGISDDGVRKKLLQQSKLTLKLCIDICRAAETTTAQVKAMKSSTSDSVLKFSSRKSSKGSSRGQHNRGRGGSSKHDSKTQMTLKFDCRYCGYKHDKDRNKCPALNETCNLCNRVGHFSRKCHSRSAKEKSRNKHVHALDDETTDETETDTDGDILSINNSNKGYKRKIFANMCLGEKGDSDKIVPIGKSVLKLTNPKTLKKHRTEFVIVGGKAQPIIGARTAQRMKLIEYVRKVPIALKKPLQKELDKLESLNIIKKVDSPTDWVSSLVAVKKPNGTLRICIDPKPLNCALKRSHYPLPVVDDLLPELANVKVYSVLDVKNGYWHVELDEPSSLLTTFGTPFGRFRWLRLPFGVKPASEIFQRHLDQVINGAKGVELIADDMLITGEGDTIEDAIKDHDQNIISLLERCRENNTKLNWDKLKFKLSEVDFSGHLFTTNGLKADPKKVEAIANMPKPTDVAGVQRLIGMINYLSRFLKGLSDACEPLRELTKKDGKMGKGEKRQGEMGMNQKDAEWLWTANHDAAFEKLKHLTTTAPVLRYFDVHEDTTIQCDASDTGLGAAIMQKEQPVAYASRALTSAERNYAQIEKELLAIVYATKKFHQYTYGRKVIVESDHRPLESIQRKPLLSAPKRLQRMLLSLQAYDIEIKYKKGNEMFLADTLSRAYLQSEDHHDTRQNVVLQFQSIRMTDYTPISSTTLREIQHATQDDEDLQELKSVILQGWPINKRDLSTACTPYFNIRDELSVENNIIFRGQQQCLVPRSMRRKILQRLHQSHDGIEACRRRARDCVYWPDINAEIAALIEQCDTCQTFMRKQQKETLQPHLIPDLPWTKVGSDLFSINQEDYLVCVDYYSDFFELDKLQTKTASEVIEKMKSHFARHGIPTEVVSDNIPYNAKDFATFAKTYGFKHTTISPGHSQSNGKLKPKTLEDVNSKKKKKIAKQVRIYDAKAKDLPELKIGNNVRVRSIRPYQKEWQKGQIDKRNDRSYELLMDDGTKIRRNRRFIRATSEPFTTSIRPDQDTEPPLVFDDHHNTSAPPSSVDKPPRENHSPSDDAPMEHPQLRTTRSGRTIQHSTRCKTEGKVAAPTSKRASAAPAVALNLSIHQDQQVEQMPRQPDSQIPQDLIEAMTNPEVWGFVQADLNDQPELLNRLVRYHEENQRMVNNQPHQPIPTNLPHLPESECLDSRTQKCARYPGWAWGKEQ
ncbi:uncharacterized protein LOC135494308 [Lineus longissimus]|uniref:uncharacterized protein LOC135494308 n=1 Tax=Lineus longissimus TaxID=88925 RepID=UPI00315D636A